MIWLYRLIFLPALLVLLPFFLWRTRRRGGGWENLGHRFGRFPGVPPKRPGVPRIWMQAVSVGELQAIVPLIEPLRRATGAEIFLSTTTTTGFARASEVLGDKVLGPAFFPVDFWPWSAAAWRAINPDLAILVEGERWPEHIHQAAARGVPLVCVNARLSDRGVRRARRVRWFARMAWRGIDRFLAGSATDAERFRTLGIAPDRIEVTGNLKLDVEIPRLASAEVTALRGELGLGDAPVLVGASTWPGEEVALWACVQAARAAGIPLRLLLVPRHVERRGDVAAWLAAAGCTHHFRSSGPAPGEVDVAVADTTGELVRLLQVADVVFVGRSLPPYSEGQTPIEAALLGKPVVFGPGMANFRDVAAGMTREGVALRVDDGAALDDAVVGLLSDDSRRTAMAVSAEAWRSRHRGAVERTVLAIGKLLQPKSDA